MVGFFVSTAQVAQDEQEPMDPETATAAVKQMVLSLLESKKGAARAYWNEVDGKHSKTKKDYTKTLALSNFSIIPMWDLGRNR